MFGWRRVAAAGHGEVGLVVVLGNCGSFWRGIEKRTEGKNAVTEEIVAECTAECAFPYLLQQLQAGEHCNHLCTA